MAVELTQPISDFDISSPRPDVRVEGLQVRHLMTTTPVTSSPDTTVREAERLKVVDDHGPSGARPDGDKAEHRAHGRR